MKIAFNPSTVAALTAPPNNKDIIFDLRGRNIFARGVKFLGTDTNTWRDIKVNNVSIGSHILDLRNGSNTTLTNTNGVVTINSTWRPVVDNLTSDSTTSSLSAKQGKVLKSLIDGKANSGHTHDDRYLKLTGGTMTGTINRRSGGSTISGRDHAIIRLTYAPGGSSWNPIACVDTETGTWTLGHLSSGSSNTDFNFCFSTNTDYNAGNNAGNYITLRNKVGIIALTSEIPSSLKNPHALTISLNGTSQGPYDGSAAKNINITPGSIGAATSGHNHDGRYLKLTGGTMSGDIDFGGDNRICWGRNTDSASISFKNDGDGDADSYMSFVTSDNGNEYFRWSHSSRSTNTEWMSLRSDGLRVGGTKVSLEGHSHNDLYYTKTEVNNKLNGKSDTSHTHDDRYLKLTGGTMLLGEGLKFHSNDNYFGTNADARIISLLDSNNKICDGGLIIDERATLDGKEYVTELLRIRDFEFKWRGADILHSGNYSGILDARYYTESEVNSLLDAKLNRQNLSYGTWNPRSYNLAADYNYNGGDLSISENGGKMYVSINGSFWLNEGRYRVLDTSDVTGLKGDLTVHLYLSSKDTNWYPLVWGGDDHRNTYTSTGGVYKSHDVLSWLTSSLTLYATRLLTTDIIFSNSGTSMKGILGTVGDNDFWRIKGGATASNSGYLEIATADDGNEPIYVRQYTTGTFSTIKRTLTLLDANGFTHFPSYINIGGNENNNSSPDRVWGSNGSDSYLRSYRTSALNVNYASSAGNADTVDGIHATKFPYINNSGIWRVYGNSVANALADNTAGLSKWAFGETRNYDISYLGILKPLTDTCGISANGTIAIFGQGDTHMGIAVDYGSANFQVFGGNADKIVWRKKIAFTDSNVASATKLQTPRTIWGQSFDGTANVSGSLSNTGTITASAAATYDIGSNSLDYRYGYFQWIGAKANTNLRLAAGNGDNQIVLHTNGNVGIGTTNPSSKLTINGNISLFNVGSIRNLAIGGGIYWNPYVESATDGSDAASITLVKTGVAGGTTLVLSLVNDANDTILFKTNGSARLYHNSYPILTTLNTYVSGNKGYINNVEITLVNNADTVDGYHASDFASSSHSHNYAANENYGGFTKSGRLPISGFYQSEQEESGGNAPWSSWMHLINCLHSNTGNNYALLIAASFFDNNIFKIRVTNNNVNNAWRDIIHSGNIGSQTVANAYHLRINSANTWSTWYWAGLSGQPSWLWGSNDGTNMYVWDPNNFNVHTALYLRSLGNLNCQTGRTLNYDDVYTYNTITDNTGSPTEYTSVIGFGRGIGGTVEIAGGWCNTGLYWRSLRDCCDDWYSWRTVLDSSNYTGFVDNYYWANVKISTSSSTTTSPTVSNLTATSSIRMGNILLEHTDEINNSANGNLYLNFRNSGNVSLCQGGGNVSIGYSSPSYKLDVNGLMRASGFHHSSMDSNNYMLLAGGGYKSFGGDLDNPIFLGYLNLDHGNDGTVSSSFSCLGYSVPFTYTRGGNYCRITIPDTTYQVFYIKAATASVNYSGGGMDTWVGYHRGTGAWWLHCYASGSNEVRVKGFCQANSNNDSWWGGNPLGANNDTANKITVCIFGYVKFR